MISPISISHHAHYANRFVDWAGGGCAKVFHFPLTRPPSSVTVETGDDKSHQTVDKKLFSPRRGRIALSANERIAEFLDYAIQAKFAYVNKL